MNDMTVPGGKAIVGATTLEGGEDAVPQAPSEENDDTTSASKDADELSDEDLSQISGGQAYTPRMP